MFRVRRWQGARRKFFQKKGEETDGDKTLDLIYLYLQEYEELISVIEKSQEEERRKRNEIYKELTRLGMGSREAKEENKKAKPSNP